jgi:hypothetical protein
VHSFWHLLEHIRIAPGDILDHTSDHLGELAILRPTVNEWT